MKFPHYLFVLCCLFLVCACNSNKQEKNNQASSTQTVTPAVVTTPANNSIDHEKKKEELEKMTPLTTEQLEKLPPAELQGAAKTDVTVNSNVGTGMVTATYLLSNNADLMLTIYDCAGAGGVGVYGVQYVNLLNQDLNDESGYTKTIDLNGGTAIEYCEKGPNDCSLTWFTGNRYLVTLEGNGTGIDILKQVGKSLKF